jgi:hypothetical protein
VGKRGGAITLPSSLAGEDRRGAAMLNSDPCGDERDKAGEIYVMLCPIRVNTYIFMCKIQEVLYIGGHTNSRTGKGTQYTFEHTNIQIGAKIIILVSCKTLYV